MRFVVLLLAITGFAAACTAQEQPRVVGYRAAAPPTIDGVIDEKEWSQVPSFSGLFDSQTGDPAPHPTTFWITYDEQFIYFAARLVDPDPGNIRATEYRTNGSLYGDDSVTVSIDPFGNYSDSSSFSINPRGATSIYIAGGRAAKREWLGEIVAKARITPEGWEAEARIPWGIMRLPGAGKRDVLINVSRSDPRRSKSYVWRYTRGDTRESSGLWTGVDVPKQRARRTLKLLPYGYGGWEEGEPLTDAGLDFKTSFTNQLELVGTVNPDFRNIENSILGLNFSYTEILADESRPFFQEGGDYFYTVPFASQRIRDVDLGLKMFGKLNDRTTLGVLSTFDFGRETVFLGGVSTRLDKMTGLSMGISNLSRAGLDNNLVSLSVGRRFGAYNLSLSGRTTNDSVFGQDVQGGMGVSYRYKNLSASTNFSYTGPDFLSRLGYFSEPGIRSLSGYFNYSQPLKGGPLQEWGLSSYLSGTDKLSGSVYSRSAGMYGNLVWREGTSISLSADVSQFLDNHDRTASFYISRPFNDYRRNWSIGTTVGEIAGKDYRNSSIGFALWPWKKFQVYGSLQEQLHFERSTLGILSWNYELGANESLNGRLVRQDQDTNVYFSFRRSGNRGAEYYLIFGDPNARTFRTSLIFKVVWPFEF